ncbi:type I phosphomannose isomerase catalytic subunit [Anaerococcus cruorum]|uniref:type I phosphomannose isomerase catalytic subunit n=1 Tax=Anaerococcus sp. WGS1596 TaxID=3366806 RepID=UPI00372D7806
MQKVLILQGDFVDKVWGGSRLKEEFGYDIDSTNVGEYWAISGMDDASSVVINGELAGEKLNDIYKEHKQLFGESEEESFPLLVKIIDATDDLSIQVHPDDEMGQKLENSRGKTECWYILNENPASIIYGLNANSKKEAVEKIENKNWDDVLKEVPANKGDFFFVPAGTVHAIKKGCLILEIQQASDITYRLYDYNRPDKEGNLRELHIDKSIEAIKLNEVSDEREIEETGNLKTTTLTSNEFFEVRKLEISGRTNLVRTSDYLLESVVEGVGVLKVDGEEYNIKKGDFFILTNEVSTYEFDGGLTIIESNIAKK